MSKATVPPPYPVALEMNWDADLNVVRQDSGPAIRSGRNELRLDRELTEMEFRVSPRRESRDDSRASVRAQARFASASPATAEATCLLPRPDQVELAIAADNDLNGSRQRYSVSAWSAGGTSELLCQSRQNISALYHEPVGERKTGCMPGFIECPCLQQALPADCSIRD